MSDSDVIVDIETDDLAATIIHVAVVQNIKTGEQTVFTGANMTDLPAVLQSARTIYGHNAVAFDIPVINRLLGAGIDTAKVRDTMLISQLLWPDRPGGHSLRAWGERVGSSKIDFHDWSLGESAEMVEYCRQDVRLTGLVLRELQAEAARMDRRGGGASWKTALDTEHRVRAIMNDVEAAGYMLDVADMRLPLSPG
jgi:DNA polymerase I